MSVKELEERVRELPFEELRKFAAWWETFRQAALLTPPEETNARSAESEPVQKELLRRQQEYYEYPERFISSRGHSPGLRNPVPMAGLGATIGRPHRTAAAR